MKTIILCVVAILSLFNSNLLFSQNKRLHNCDSLETYGFEYYFDIEPEKRVSLFRHFCMDSILMSVDTIVLDSGGDTIDYYSLTMFTYSAKQARVYSRKKINKISSVNVEALKYFMDDISNFTYSTFDLNSKLSWLESFDIAGEVFVDDDLDAFYRFLDLAYLSIKEKSRFEEFYFSDENFHSKSIRTRYADMSFDDYISEDEFDFFISHFPGELSNYRLASCDCNILQYPSLNMKGRIYFLSSCIPFLNDFQAYLISKDISTLLNIDFKNYFAKKPDPFFLDNWGFFYPNELQFMEYKNSFFPDGIFRKEDDYSSNILDHYPAQIDFRIFAEEISRFRKILGKHEKEGTFPIGEK